MKIIFKSALLAVMLIGFSCQKNTTVNTEEISTEKKITVYLTDAPATYDKVNVDLLAVKINYENEPEKWVDINTNAGIYDLLTLQNGVSVMIASGNIKDGNIKEIRLELGPNNTIVVNGITKPLIIPSGAENGLKLKFPGQESINLQGLLIDFDAALSIHKQGQGSYILRPVLKLMQKNKL